MSSLWRLVAAVAISFVPGVVGMISSFPSIYTWYPTLAEPAFTPPNWMFFPVWTILYFLMGIALWLVWEKEHAMHGWVRCFIVMLLFNGAWPIFFFGYHTTLIAFMDIICLDFIVIALTVGAWEIRKSAAYLLMPYLAWIIYASYLSAGFWWLNF